MQHIATAKSDFAALPVKVNSAANQYSDYSTHFRSYLDAAAPKPPSAGNKERGYTQPVEPNPINKVSQPSSQAQSRQQSDVNNNQSSQNTRQQDISEQGLRNTKTDQEQNSQAVASQSEKKSTNNNDGKDQSIDNETTRKQNESATRTQSTEESTDYPGQQLSVDAEVDAPRNNSAGPIDSPEKRLNAADGIQQFDWLQLVENSQKVNLDGGKVSGNMTDNSNASDLLSGAEIEFQDIDLSKISALTELANDIANGTSELSGEDQQILLGIIHQLGSIASQQDSSQATVEFDAILVELKKLISSEQVKADYNGLLTQHRAAAQSQSGIEENELQQDDLALLLELIRNNDETADAMQGGRPDNLDVSATKDVNQWSGSSQSNLQTNPSAIQSDMLKELEIAIEDTDIPHGIKSLLAVPENKLDAILDNLSGKLEKVLRGLEKSSDKGLDSETLAIEKALQLKPSGLESSPLELVSNQGDVLNKPDFVASLKAGLEEIKAQLKQGHQPAIDLKTLVAESLAEQNVKQLSPDQLSQTVNRFSQVLELASQLTNRGDSNVMAGAVDRQLSKDSASQANLSQTKQSVQHAAHFDKAINITRSEGHQQLVERVRFMVNQNNLQAEIRLDPPDLGAMKVRINMSGDTASVNIVVQSQQARDVLEQAAPRLKEMLEEQGIQLGQSSVEQDNQSSADSQSGEYAMAGKNADTATDESATQVLEHPIVNGRLGGIDYFV